MNKYLLEMAMAWVAILVFIFFKGILNMVMLKALTYVAAACIILSIIIIHEIICLKSRTEDREISTKNG